MHERSDGPDDRPDGPDDRPDDAHERLEDPYDRFEDARERLHGALASHADDYEVLDRLHDVPPYEVYEVRLDGRRAVCKLDAHPEGDAATEGLVAAYVARETSVPVPAVLGVGDDHFLMAYSEAVPDRHEGDEGPDLEPWARAAGAGLARLHAETSFAATGLPSADAQGDADREPGALPVDAHASWAGTVRAFLRRRREYLAGTGYADVADRVLAFVDEHPGAFAVGGEEPEPVLCHGNWLFDHVGVEDEEVTAVIDFEHALVGPGEYDYWRARPYAYDDDPGPAAAFRAGYASVRPLPEGFDRRRELYRVLNTVSYFRALLLQDQHGPEETERRAEWMREYVAETLAELRGRFG